MAKKSAKQSRTAGMPGMYKPKPEVRFELADGILDDLPQVGKPVSLSVTGTLSKVAKDEYGPMDCITVQQPKVKLAGKPGKT